MTSTPNTTTTAAPSIWDDLPDNYPHTDPAHCQPWCHARAGGGHLAFRDGGEVECSTDLTEVTLTLGNEVDYGRGEMRPDFVHAYLWYAKPEGVTVNLSHHEDPGPTMTPAEARQLAETLVRLADLAEARRAMNSREQAIYDCGRLAGLREQRAMAPRWLGPIPHELPCGIETWFYGRIGDPIRRLWRRLNGRPEYDDCEVAGR